MSEPIKVVHAGITITYHEGDDRWDFVLRGRERREDTLANAKEAIDKPVKEKRKAFERMACWVRIWSNQPEKVIVTSIGQGKYGSCNAWATAPNGSRSRYLTTDLYPCDIPTNQEKMARMLEICKTMQDLINEKQKLSDKMVKLNPEDYSE